MRMVLMRPSHSGLAELHARDESMRDVLVNPMLVETILPARKSESDHPNAAMITMPSGFKMLFEDSTVEDVQAMLLGGLQ